MGKLRIGQSCFILQLSFVCDFLWLVLRVLELKLFVV